MIITTITDAKNKLSALIDRVRAGETVLIMERGRPVARLESAVSGPADADGRLLRLQRTGLVGIGTGEPSDEILSFKPPSASNNASAVEALLEERKQGR